MLFRSGKKRNILLCHQFITGAVKSDSEEHTVGGLDQIDAAVFDAFDYVALGHIHRPQRGRRGGRGDARGAGGGGVGEEGREERKSEGEGSKEGVRTGKWGRWRRGVWSARWVVEGGGGEIRVGHAGIFFF